MQKIKKLTPEVIAKIAAGEVIERPSFAVKELIENAIDAKATAITIHVEESGLSKIQVSDNGEGMSREDIEISFLPHTTSKLVNEDLHGIKTLGFRGEALASLAAISNLTIQSRQADNPSGTVLELRQGHIEHIGNIGTPPGTIVTATQLFSSIPARKKFLKSAKTEFRHISDIVLSFALAYPTIHFHLLHNNKTVFDIPAKKDLSERLSLVFGTDITENLLSISFSEGYLSFSGFIGKPQVASKNNQRQFVYVNKRVVTNKIISLAIRESFGTLLPATATPVFTLHLTVPHETVDINIHPRKEHISFMNNQFIFDQIKIAVTQLLSAQNITYSLSHFNSASIKKGETTSFSGQLLKDIVLPWNRTEDEKIQTNAQLLQIHQTYVFTSTKQGILLFDQHAVHERILFEKFKKSFVTTKQKKETFLLPKSVLINLSLSEKQIFDEFQNDFVSFGFNYIVKENTMSIKSVPLVFKGRNVEKIIKDILADLADDKMISDIDIRSHRMIAFLSCRAAIKAGDVLSEKNMRQLLVDLEQTGNNETCPHGRPTRIFISLANIDKEFKR